MPEIASLHPGVQHLLGQFGYMHLPEHLRAVSAPFHDLAQTMAFQLGNSPEMSAGLRKLLEAKDCMVRQAVIDAKTADTGANR